MLNTYSVYIEVSALNDPGSMYVKGFDDRSLQQWGKQVYKCSLTDRSAATNKRKCKRVSFQSHCHQDAYDYKKKSKSHKFQQVFQRAQSDKCIRIDWWYWISEEHSIQIGWFCNRTYWTKIYKAYSLVRVENAFAWMLLMELYWRLLVKITITQDIAL